MRDVPLRQRGVFSALFFLQHWFPRSKRVQRRKGAVRPRIIEHVRTGGKGRLLNVERRKGLSALEFRAQYLRRGLPVILDGAARDWTCTRDWSVDNLRRRFGTETIKRVQGNGLAVDE